MARKISWETNSRLRWIPWLVYSVIALAICFFGQVAVNRFIVDVSHNEPFKLVVDLVLWPVLTIAIGSVIARNRNRRVAFCVLRERLRSLTSLPIDTTEEQSASNRSLLNFLVLLIAFGPSRRHARILFSPKNTTPYVRLQFLSIIHTKHLWPLTQQLSKEPWFPELLESTVFPEPSIWLAFEPETEANQEAVDTGHITDTKVIDLFSKKVRILSPPPDTSDPHP